MNFDDSRWNIPIIDDRTKKQRGVYDPKGIIDKGKNEIQRQEQEISRDGELIKNFLSLGIEIEVANSIHDKYMRELFRLSELEKSKAMELAHQKILEWYFRPEPISLYGFLLMEYLRSDKISQEEREKDDGSPSEIFDKDLEISEDEKEKVFDKEEEQKSELFDDQQVGFQVDDIEPEITTIIEAPGRILGSDLGVRLPSQAEQILDLSDIPQQAGILTEQLEIEVPEIKLPKSEPIRAYSIEHIVKQKLELLQEGFDSGRRIFERRWTIAEITKKAYEYDVERLQKKLGDSPTIPDVLKHLLNSARNNPEGSYFHVVSGVREGYPLLYKIIEKILPSKTERENMKHHAKLSGYDVRESRPIVEVRQQEITPDMMSKLYEKLNPKYIGAVKVIEYAWNRRNELNRMTIKLGSKRDVIELKFPVSKQKRQTKMNTIKIHKKFFPEAFADLGRVLCETNGSKSIRQSSFEAVSPFPDLKMDTLEEAFKVARRRAGLPEWITLHSLKHQGVTDARKGGLDDEGIAQLTQHTDVKNVRFYGIL